MFDYSREDRLSDRYDVVFRWLGVVLLLALAWSAGYWAGGSDEKAGRAIQAEQSAGSKR